MTIKQRKILIFLIITVCFSIGFFAYANSQSNNRTIEQFNNRISDEPEFLSISADPGKVKVGDILTITAEIRDENGIEKVSAIMPFENGADEIQLKKTTIEQSDNGTIEVWQGEWKCHGTINVEYVTTVTAINVLGKSATGEVSWWDDTETVWLSGWNHRIKLTIDSSKVDANLSDFPALVYLSSDSSGIGDVDVSCVFDELTEDANRKKIAITKSDGTTECYVEIEKWDDANEQAWIWTKVSGADSILAASDTVLYLYFDADHADNTTYVDDVNTRNAHNVWDANYKMVHHMEENPAGGATPDSSDEMFDSTSNNNDGNTGGTMLEEDQVTGQIDGSVDFDGTDDYVNCGSHSSLNITDAITIEAWVKVDVLDSNYQGIVANWNSLGGTRKYGLFIDPSNKFSMHLSSTGSDNVNVISNLVPTIGQWYHIIGTRSSDNNMFLYINGVKQTDTDTISGIYNNIQTSTIGWFNSNIYSFDGTIDQVRITNDARTAAEIKADYNSGNDSLITFGSEIEKRPNAPGISPHGGGFMMF